MLAQAGGGEGGGGTGSFPFPLVLALIAAVFYFLVFRPSKKQQDARRRMIETLKKGDEVQTESGIFGRIDHVDGDKNQVVLKVDDQSNTRIRVLRTSIQGIVNSNSNSQTQSKDSGSPRK